MRRVRRTALVGAVTLGLVISSPQPVVAHGRRYVIHHDSVWDDLDHCESTHGLDRRARGNRFSFKLSTWRSLGMTGRPADHLYEVQLDAAQRLVNRSGWRQFPACSRLIKARGRWSTELNG